MHIDGSTRVVGVFGSPIQHTASPAMHNAAYAALQMNWAYLPFHVEPANLRRALDGARDMGFVGVNLTLPHKLLALKMVGQVDEEAARLGAVNTVAFRDGITCGYNTDGYGITKALQEEFNLVVKDRNVLVLGAGGAGRGIAVKCALEGAARIHIANRTVSKIKPIQRELEQLAVECVALRLESEALRPAIEQAHLIINATSVGLQPDELLPIESKDFHASQFVYDTIYRPAKTRFLELASAAGAKTANGLSMLLHQGARSFEIWSDNKAPVAMMRRALRAAVYGETV